MIAAALTIAGSDCSGGAGIQADLKAFSALGVFGMSVVTSVVAENTKEVLSICDIPQSFIQDQMEAVFSDIPPAAIKVGMLSHKDTMDAVAEGLLSMQEIPIVLDPVMVAKGGCALMELSALETLQQKLLPLCTVLTPNLPEAEALLERKLTTKAQREDGCKALHSMGVPFVLLKGGHLDEAEEAEDLLYDGTSFYRYTAPRIPTKNTHGTGCTFSSAIAAYLAKGEDVYAAIAKAKDYVQGAIVHSLELGKGHGPLNHFYRFWEA